MRAVIPHRSIAIMTSSRGKIQDARVREPDDGIIASQKKEIAGMKDLIVDLDRKRVDAGRQPVHGAAVARAPADPGVR